MAHRGHAYAGSRAHQGGDVGEVGVVVEPEALGHVRDDVERAGHLRVVGPGGLLLPRWLGPIQQSVARKF